MEGAILVPLERVSSQSSPTGPSVGSQTLSNIFSQMISNEKQT